MAAPIKAGKSREEREKGRRIIGLVREAVKRELGIGEGGGYSEGGEWNGPVWTKWTGWTGGIKNQDHGLLQSIIFANLLGS
jgi:hypothetical protein